MQIKYIGPHVGPRDEWKMSAGALRKAGTHDGGAGFPDAPALTFNARNGFTAEVTDPKLAEWIVDNHSDGQGRALFEIVDAGDGGDDGGDDGD